MKVFIIIVVVLIFLAALAFATCITVDKVIMGKKLKMMKSGMTGYQIQESSNVRLKFLSMDGDYYYAKVVSPLHFFKYNLVFKNGRLKEIEKI